LRARTKKKPRQKLPWRFRLFLSLCFILLLSVGSYYFLSLPIWRITAVEVSGAKMLVPDEIRDLSGVPVSANLFLTSLARTRENLKKITAIKDFHLYRIPPGAVIIKIEERKPIAVLLFENKSAIVDADGFILNRNPNLTVNIPNMTELPVIAGLGTAEYEGEERISPRSAQLIVEIITELSALLGSRHLQLSTGGFEKISFSLDDLLPVKVGRNENIKRKLEIFKALLSQVNGRWAAVEYIDVRYPDNPVVKFK